MRRAIYAGSFDPVTNGHVWMIESASACFDEVEVVIGENPTKKPLFSLEERLRLLDETTSHLDNVDIGSFENRYLVDYAREQEVSIIVRGLRDATDFTFESQMRHANEDIDPSITTVFLMPPLALQKVSSSFVKGLVGPTGWEVVVQKYVPRAVFKALQAMN